MSTIKIGLNGLILAHDIEAIKAGCPQTANNKSQHHSIGEAAELQSVTPDTGLKWIKKGQLRAVRTAGACRRLQLLDPPDTADTADTAMRRRASPDIAASVQTAAGSNGSMTGAAKCYFKGKSVL
jgi:excisionase family DNA binding protein